MFSYLRTPEARMTIIVPILIYNITFWGVGAGMALVATACYLAVMEIFSKRSGSLSIIALILVSGSTHYLYLHGYTLFDIKQESVFLLVAHFL